jgi:hypothetical protein
MISSPKTAAPAADVGNVQPEKVSTNQRAVPLTYFSGRKWLALTWAQSNVYNPQTKAVTQKVGKSKQVTGYDYYGDLFGLTSCCLNDWLEAIEVNGKIMWAGGIARDEAHPHHSGDIVIPGVGTFRYYWGTEDQPADGLVLAGCGELHPRYLDQSYLVAKSVYFGNNNATPPTIRVLVERAARFAGLPEDRSREGTNGITAAAEVIGNDWFGLARPEIIDVDTWAALGATIRRDTPVAVPGDPEHIAAMGFISPYADRIQAVQSFLARILENYDAWLRRKDDKIEIGQFPHDGVVPGGLAELNFHDFIEPPTFDADDDDGDLITDAIVTHLERENNMEEDSQPSPNMAARDRIGEIREKQFARPFIVTGYQAREQANELAKFYSRPEEKCSVPIRRERIVGLRSGDRFILNDAPSSQRIVVRVTQRRDASDGGRVDLSLVQERGLAPLGYVPVPQQQPTLPSPDLVAIAHARMFQLPQKFGDFAPALAVVALAERPAAHTAGFHVNFSVAGVTYDEIARELKWALRASLAAGILGGAVTFTVNAAGFDLALLAAQSDAAKDDDTLLLFCGYEIMSVGNVVALGGGQYQLTVFRGRRGSAAAAHAGGDECFIIPRESLEILQHADFPRNTVNRYFKLATYTTIDGGEEQELADALALVLLFDDNAVASPAPLVLTAKAEAIFLSWTDRTKDDPTIIATDIWERDSGAVAPVPGVDLPTFSLLASGFNRGGLAQGAVKYYWIANRDTASTYSALIGPQNATAGAVPAGPTGPTGNSRERRYKRSTLVPATPTGNNPAGWTVDIPSGTDALWASEATKDGSGNVVGSWSTPQRLSGSVIFYTSGAPAGYTLIDGDTYFDIADSFKIYRYSGGSWIPSFQPLLKLDGNNNVSGLVKADGTDKAFVLVADKFQVWNGVSAEVPFEIVSGATYIKNAFIQQVAAGKITAGTIDVALALGVLGTFDAASGDNAFHVDSNGAKFGTPSGVHVEIRQYTTGAAAVMLYNGATLKGFWTYDGGTTFDNGGGVIQNVSTVNSQVLKALSSSDPRTIDAPLKTSGGAWIEKTLDQRGKAYFNDETSFNGKMKLLGTNHLEFNQDGSGNTYLAEGWGIQAHGDSTHPFQVRSAALCLDGCSGGGTSYTSGRLYFNDSVYLELVAGALFLNDANGYRALT